MVEVSFVVKGRLPGYNQLTKGHWATQKRVKDDAKRLVQLAVFANRVPRFDKPVAVRICCFEPNAKRDIDNIKSGACKVILDALQEIRVLKGDGQKYVVSLETPDPVVDKVNPRIEVTIWEVEK